MEALYSPPQPYDLVAKLKFKYIFEITKGFKCLRFVYEHIDPGKSAILIKKIMLYQYPLVLGTYAGPYILVWISFKGVRYSLMEEGKGQLWIFPGQQAE